MTIKAIMGRRKYGQSPAAALKKAAVEKPIKEKPLL